MVEKLFADFLSVLCDKTNKVQWCVRAGRCVAYFQYPACTCDLLQAPHASDAYKFAYLTIGFQVKSHKPAGPISGFSRRWLILSQIIPLREYLFVFEV